MNNVYISNREFLKRIGKVITRLRTKEGVKQENMAKSLGITQSALSKYENGKTDIPVLKLKEISDKYSVPITDFFVEEELPSELYRKIVRAPSARKEDKGDDAVFNDYILNVKNSEKRDILKASVALDDAGLLDENNRTRVVRYIIEVNVQNEACGRVLKEYAKRIQKLIQEKGDGNYMPPP